MDKLEIGEDIHVGRHQGTMGICTRIRRGETAEQAAARLDITAMSEAELVRLAARVTRRWPGFTAVIDARGQFGLVADWLLAELSPVSASEAHLRAADALRRGPP